MEHEKSSVLLRAVFLLVVFTRRPGAFGCMHRTRSRRTDSRFSLATKCGATLFSTRSNVDNLKPLVPVWVSPDSFLGDGGSLAAKAFVFGLLARGHWGAQKSNGKILQNFADLDADLFARVRAGNLLVRQDIAPEPRRRRGKMDQCLTPEFRRCDVPGHPARLRKPPRHNHEGPMASVQAQERNGALGPFPAGSEGQEVTACE